jgi:hypothetical protein
LVKGIPPLNKTNREFEKELPFNPQPTVDFQNAYLSS